MQIEFCVGARARALSCVLLKWFIVTFGCVLLQWFIVTFGCVLLQVSKQSHCGDSEKT